MFGKNALLGALIGAPVAGPVGSLVGAAVGAVRDMATSIVNRSAIVISAPPPMRITFVPKMPVASRGPTAAQLEASAEERAANMKVAAAKRAAAMKIAAINAEFMLHKPARDSQPADILKYAQSWQSRLPPGTPLAGITNLSNLKNLYPEWPWVHETGTKYHADYDWGNNGDHVHWYVNGVQGYQHTWGGVDFGRLAGQAFDIIEQVANIAATVGSVVNLVPWQYIADGIEAASSTIPVLGTAVSDYVATIEIAVTLAGGGSMTDISFRIAYNYLMATTPGAAVLRPIIDPVEQVLERILNGKVPDAKTAIAASVADVPAGLPRQLAASLAATVANDIGIH